MTAGGGSEASGRRLQPSPWPPVARRLARLLLAAGIVLPAGCVTPAPTPPSRPVAAVDPTAPALAGRLAAIKPLPTPAPVQVQPAVAVAPPPALDSLLGRSPAQVEELLGRPDAERVDGPAQVWQFRGRDCVLHMFFYPHGGETVRRLMLVDATQRLGGPATPAACLAGLRSDPIPASLQRVR